MYPGIACCSVLADSQGGLGFLQDLQDGGSGSRSSLLSCESVRLLPISLLFLPLVSCVLRYDHHCPYADAPIGFFNYKYYLLLLVYGLIATMHLLYLSLVVIILHLSYDFSLVLSSYRLLILIGSTGCSLSHCQSGRYLSPPLSSSAPSPPSPYSTTNC